MNTPNIDNIKYIYISADPAGGAQHIKRVVGKNFS